MVNFETQITDQTTATIEKIDGKWVTSLSGPTTDGETWNWYAWNQTRTKKAAVNHIKDENGYSFGIINHYFLK